MRRADPPREQPAQRHNGTRMTTSDAILMKYLFMSHRVREPDCVQARRFVFCSISCATALTPRISPKSGANVMPKPMTTSFNFPLL